MRIFLTVFLIFGVVTGAFAQFNWSFFCAFNVDSFKFRTPVGMNTERNFTDPGGVNVRNPHFAGNQLRLFTQNDMFFANEMLMGFYYRMDAMDFYVRVHLNNLIHQNLTSYGNAPIGGSGTMTWGGHGGSAEQVLRSRWSEWYIRTWPGIYRFFAGNISDRGVTTNARFNVHADSTVEGGPMDNFGMLTPLSRMSGGNYLANIAFIRSLEHEGNNFARANRVVDNHWADWFPYFLGSINLHRVIGVPLTVQIGADIGNAFNVFSSPANASETANTLVDGMLRIQGTRIANILSFDLTWHFRGNDSNTLNNWNMDDPDGVIQPDGSGRYAHSIGAYAWFLPDAFINGLTFSLGYTAYFRARENFEYVDYGYRDVYRSPLFSGLDIRAQYTGLPNFRFTFNNNISFATARGTDDTSVGNWEGRNRKINAGLIQNDLLGPNQVQNWFALYNGFYTDYTINRVLSAHLFLVNRFTLFSDAKAWQGNQKPATLFLDKEVLTTHMFYSYVFLRYRTGNFQFMAGLMLEYLSYRAVYSYINGTSQEIWDVNTGPGTGSKDREIGTFTVSVPLRMRVNFRNR
jgi:hypothetical protein